MKDNRKRGTRLANQTGSQSGNPRNQELQREDEERGNVSSNKGERYRSNPASRDKDVGGEGRNKNRNR
jgi:hypothetical protein